MFSFSELYRILNEASYKGNIGIMELSRFFEKSKKNDPKLYEKVKKLISDGDSKEVWRIIQDYLNVKLVGK